MEKSFVEQLKKLNDSIVEMGNLCEESIVNATKRLITGDDIFEKRAMALDQKIDLIQRYIQMMCIKLLVKTPVSDDVKMLNTAMAVISEMEQIGEQGKDITEVCRFISSDIEYVIVLHIAKMADVVSNMVRQAVMSFVLRDSKMAHVVISHDYRVNSLFLGIKTDLLDLIGNNVEKNQEILESLMIAKYLERVGDYTVNIAESVIELLR